MPNNSYTQQHHADILLVTATQIETKMLLDLFEKELNVKYSRYFLGGLACFDLGQIKGAKVSLIQSEMGSSGLGGSSLTISEGISALTPTAVIMVGIAFGVNERKQRIGDILVAQQLLLYDLQRIGTDANSSVSITLRDDKPHASPRLLAMFKSGALDWQGAPVTFGVVLSGDKLVDNVDYRQQLLHFAGEAIGGEMEGAGLYVAAQRAKVDWILVKAICDWADGNKSRNKRKRQELAAGNAASFIIHVLKLGGFSSSSGDNTVRGQTAMSGKTYLQQSGNDEILPDWMEIVEQVRLKGREDPDRRFLVDRNNVIVTEPSLLRDIFEARRRDFPLMMIGKLGTGKNVVLDLINRGTKRKDRPFKDLNLKGSVEEIDKNFFGTQSQPGFIEQNNGALIHFDFMENLLDKPLIADKLISLIEEGEFTRYDRTPARVDVRVIGGATIDLGSVFSTTASRHDNLLLHLYERLSSRLTIRMKQIVEMPERIPTLIAETYATLYLNGDFTADELNKVTWIPASVLRTFQEYNWTSNFLEFSKVVKGVIRDGAWDNALNELSYSRPPTVFVSYGFEDEERVEKLHRRLKDLEFDVVKAKEGFPLPGQDWKNTILKAIRNSDFVLVCLSKASISKTGFFQREIREALEQQRYLPAGSVYIIPVLLDEIDLPLLPEELRSIHCAKLYEDWDREFAYLVKVISNEYYRHST